MPVAKIEKEVRILRPPKSASFIRPLLIPKGIRRWAGYGLCSRSRNLAILLAILRALSYR